MRAVWVEDQAVAQDWSVVHMKNEALEDIIFNDSIKKLVILLVNLDLIVGTEIFEDQSSRMNFADLE